MSKLPTKPGAGKPPASLDAGIALLRSTLEKPEKREIRTLSLSCAVQNKPYVFICERTDKKARFKAGPAQKVIDDGGGQFAQIDPALKLAEFDLRDIDFEDQACPWCRRTAAWVLCRKCSTAYCGGQRPLNGGDYRFTCPTCNDSFQTGLTTTTKIQGSSSTTGYDPVGGKAAPQVGQVQRKLLPKWMK